MEDKVYSQYVSTLAKNLLRQAFSHQDNFRNIQEIAKCTNQCNMEKVINKLVEAKVMNVQTFRDPASQSNQQMIGLIKIQKARVILRGLKILTNDEVEAIINTCTARGLGSQQEELFNYLDLIMLSRSFKVDNYIQDQETVKKLQMTIKDSKELLNSNIRKSCPTRGSKINKFFHKLRNCLFSLSAKKEQIFKKMLKNSEGRISYGEIHKTLKNMANFECSIDELQEYLFKFMPKNQTGMDQYQFKKFITQLDDLTFGGQTLREHQTTSVYVNNDSQMKLMSSTNIHDLFYEIASYVFKEQIQLCNYFHKNDTKGNGFISKQIFINNLAEEFPGLTEEYSLRQLFERYGHKTDDYIDVVNLVKTCLLTIIEQIFNGNSNDYLDEDIAGKPKLSNVFCSPVRQNALRKFISGFYLDALDILRCLRKMENLDMTTSQKLDLKGFRNVLRDYKIEMTNTQVAMIQQYFNNQVISFKLFEALQYAVWGFTIF